MKKQIIAASLFIFLTAVWAVVFIAFKSEQVTLFPNPVHEIYAVTDANFGGVSTSEIMVNDSQIVSQVNVRSGVAYAHGGVGFNLKSVKNLPADFFDFSKYDSLFVKVETNRMKNIAVKILNNDKVYSVENNPLSLRPLKTQFAVSSNVAAIPLSHFKVEEWWLALVGLEKDDGMRYMERGNFLEVINGDGTLRGIPDEILIKNISLYGVNSTFKILMYFALGILILVYAGFVYRSFYNSKNQLLKKEKSLETLKSKMKLAAELLKNTDKSVAEIAIEIGEKSASDFEKNFKNIYKKNPLEFRKN